MKKRFIATPIVLIAAAITWNIVLHQQPEPASAEALKPYLAPTQSDTRFPIEVFQVPVSGGETEADVLSHLNTTIYPEDRVSFVIDPALGLGTIVHIERAANVTVKDGKFTLQKRTFANTVGDLLSDIHRELDPLDKANHAVTAQIEPGMTINITRVKKVKRTVKEPVDFKTTTKQDGNLERGKKKVETAGKKGERTKIYEDTREDGEVVSSVLLSNQITTEPVTRVEVEGTKILYGSKTVAGRATWYDLRTKVASNTFPRGTWVEIKNMDNGKTIEVKVDDTGAFTSETAIDLSPVHFESLGGKLGAGILPRVQVRQVLNPKQ